MKNLIKVLIFLLFISPSWLFAESSNFVMLGFFYPIDSDEGLSTPIIYLDHKSKDYPLNGSLSFKIETSTVSTLIEHKIGNSGFYFGYGATGTYLSESLGTDIYKNGERLEDYSYDGSSASFLASLRFEFTEKWDAKFLYSNKKTWFEENDDTDSTFILPPEYSANIYELAFKHNGSFFSDNGSFEISFISAKRDDMENWELDNDAVSKEDYDIQKFKWVIPFETEKNRGELVIKGANGHHMDILNDLDVGGMASEYSAGGFYRTEFRAKRVLSLNYSHQYLFTKNRRLLLFSDLLYFESIDLSYLDGTDRDQTIGSVGIGFYYGIESLKGLPVIVRYGEGLNVDDASRESHRREIMVLVAAEF